VEFQTRARALFAKRWLVLLSGGALAANLGDGLRIAAFALLASSVSHDARQIASVAVAASLPNLLLALPIGVLVDRANRIRLMWSVNLIRVGLYAALTLVITFGTVHIWQLAVCAAALGICELVYDSSSSAIVPSLAKSKELRPANTVVRLSQEIGNGAVGPALGGLLFAVWNGLPLLAASILFVVSFVLIRRLARHSPEIVSLTYETTDKGLSAATRQFGSDVCAGIEFTLRSMPVRWLMAVYFAWNLFGWMPESVLVLFVRDELHAPPIAFGLLLTVTAAGAIIGGIGALNLSDKIHDATLLIASIASYGLMFLIAARTNSIWLVGAAFFLQGIPLIALSAATSTMRETVVPSHMLGKVGALLAISGSLATTFGLWLGGVLADTFDARSTLI